MADLQSIMQALRNADAAGNTADAQRLAMLAQQYKNTTPSADPNAPDTGLMTGIANRALAIGEGLMNLPDTVTEAVTGYKDPRLLVPGDADQFMGVDWRNIGDTKFVENTPDIHKLENPLGFTGDEFENAGKFLQEKREALNYAPKVPWNEVKSNPSPQNVLGFMGEAAITSLPDMAAAIIATPAYFASYIAPIAQKRAENDGGRDVTPADLAYAAVASLGIASAERFGAKGIFGDVYGNVAQRITGAGAREGTTEAIQNPLQYAAETVDTQTGFDPIEALDQAAAGAVGGTGAGVGLRTATEVATGGSMREPEDREAAAALANRLDATAKADKLNPRNVSNRVSTKGARALLDQTHVELSEEIQESYDNLGKAIKKDKTDDAETQRLKRLAKAGLRQAKNKVKNTVGTREMDAVRTLVGNTRQGQQLINLMRESNELTTLHNRGLKGGLSKYTDMVAPLSSGSGYNPRPLIEVPTRAALTGTAAINTGGASLVPQAAIYAGGRVVDAITGKRSNVANFIKNNKNSVAPPTASGVSIDDSRVDQKAPNERQKRQNRRLFELNAPIATNVGGKPSPQQIIAERTGLDRQGIFNAAEEMKSDPRYTDFAEELNQVQRSIVEGGKIPNVGNVADIIATHIGVKAEQTTRVAPLQQAKIQQGINDNRERIESLRQQAMQDTALNDFDRQLINDALDDLKRDLGTNPVDTAERIVSSAGTLARNKSAVTKYLNPYLDRVRQQQKRKKPDGVEQVEKMAMFDPIDFNEYEDTTYYHGTPNIFKEFDSSKLGATTGSDWMGTADFSAKQGFWFTDDAETALSYADYGAKYKPVNEAFDLATGAEEDGNFELAERLEREAEQLEQEIDKQPLRGQTIIPVRLPKNLAVLDVEGASYNEARDKVQDAIKKARSDGYDGLKVLNLSDTADYSVYRPATHVLVFDAAKIRSKFAPKQQTEAAQLPFEPFLTEELMGRPLDAREIQFNEMEKGVYGLRNQLERMQMRAGEGVLSNRKKSSDIGNMQLNFDPRKVSEYRKSIIDKAVASLDPEGRELISELQVGLNGDGGLTNEQIAILVPSVVRAIEFMSGAQASERSAYGRYAKVTSPAGNFMRNRIEVADLGEIVEGYEKTKMHSEKFLNTLLHEVGHAIGDRSNLDELVNDTILLGKLEPDDTYYELMNQLTRVSKIQRRDLWDSLDDTLQALQQRTGYYLGPALQSYQLKLDRDGDVEELTHQVQQRAMAEGQILNLDQIPRLMNGIASQIRYLNSPKELVADAVSYYLQKPKQMKELFPDLAKVIRKGVNESSLQQFITFHSIAGLLGAAGMAALLTGDDEDNPGIFRQMLGRGALNAA